MNLENLNKKELTTLGTADQENDKAEGDYTVLIQEQKKWNPFDKHIDKESKRLPASPEQVEIMNQRLKDLSDLFSGFDKWHLDGALNISLLKKEYIGYHKDVDISTERNNLKDLEVFLEKKGYGFFLSQNEDTDKEGERVMRRVNYLGIENYEGHPMICALGEKGKIDKSVDLNYIDLHIIDRDDKNLPLLASGVNCPESWTKSYPIEKDGQKINLSHPVKVLYYKLNQGRNYDSTDVDRLLELGVVKEDDINEIKSIYELEFIKKKKDIFSICDKISHKIKLEMKEEEVFKVIKEIEEFKNKNEIDEPLKVFANAIIELKNKSSENISDLAITMFDVEGKNQEKKSELERIRYVIRDKEELKKIRDKIKTVK